MSTGSPHETESVPVILARMEGKLDNVIEKVCDLRTEVTSHGSQIVALQFAARQLESDAAAAASALVSADLARDDTAKALRQADDVRIQAAKEKADEAAHTWTTVQRLSLIIGIVLTVILIYVAIRGLVPSSQTLNVGGA